MEPTPQAEITEKEPTKKEWRGFWTLLFVQAQNAMNEKGAQFLLVPLGVALADQCAEMSQYAHLQYLLGAVIVLPYLIISPFVGWLSDRFSKTRIVRLMAFMQIIVLLAMWVSLHYHNIDMAIVWFTVFAFQATILSPAKKGVVKDMVGEKYIGYASSLIEMSSVFAILIGQILVLLVYGLMTDWGYDAWESASWPTLVLMMTAVPLFLMTFIVPNYPPVEKPPFRWKLFIEHFGQIKVLWSDRRLRLSETGIAYFWFFASVMLLIALEVAELIVDNKDQFALESCKLMAWLSGGVVVGGIIISQLNKRKVELGTVPMGAMGMTLSCVMLAFLPIDGYFFNVALATAGLSGAFFFLPLNAYLQNTSSDADRGNIIAAGNFLDMALGLVAVGFQYALRKVFGLSIGEQCMVMAVLCFGITVITFRLTPREFIRLIGMWLIQLFFRPRVLNVSRVPKTGGVLLVSNHVTLVDALFLTLACPRPIRFLVAEEYITVKMLGWVLELFNSVPISNRHPGEAINAAAKALRNGEVICVFPEGQLTRTGVMTELHRGVEVIAQKGEAPILPIYMDNLWSGFMSYKRPKQVVMLPTRIPQRFAVVYGELIPYQDFSIELLRTKFQELSVASIEAVAESGRSSLLRLLEAMGTREVVRWDGGKWLATDVLRAFMENEVPEGDSLGVEWMRLFVSTASDKEKLPGRWLNALQLKKVNALLPGEPLMVCLGVLEKQSAVVSVLWPLMTKTPVYLLSREYDIPEHVRQIAGSIEMRKKLERVTPLNNYLPFFDFSGHAPLSSLPNITTRPCLSAAHGEVLAMSMNREVYIIDKENRQYGIKFGGHGLLLPGYVSAFNEETGRTLVTSPMLDEPFELPESYFVDEHNFVLEKIDL